MLAILSEMPRKVIYDNFVSSLFHIPQGLPQGSPLAPLLYICYITDLPDFLTRLNHGLRFDNIPPNFTNTLEQFPILKFADDMLTISNTYTRLQNTLVDISHYLSAYNSLLNPKKCLAHAIIPPVRRNATPSCTWPQDANILPPNILNSPIPITQPCQPLRKGTIINHPVYLGVRWGTFTTSGHDWNETIKNTYNKAYGKSNNILTHLRSAHRLTASTVSTSFYAEIIPILEYCSVIWGPYIDQQASNKMQSIQTHFFRTCFNLPHAEYHTTTIDIDFGLTPLELRRDDLLFRQWNRLTSAWEHITDNQSLSPDNINNPANISISPTSPYSHRQFYTFLLFIWSTYNCNIKDNTKYGPSYTWFSAARKRFSLYHLDSFFTKGIPIPDKDLQLAFITRWYLHISNRIDTTLTRLHSHFPDNKYNLDILYACATKSRDTAVSAVHHPKSYHSYFHDNPDIDDVTHSSNRIRSIFIRYLYLDLFPWNRNLVLRYISIRNGSYNPLTCPACKSINPSPSHIFIHCEHPESRLKRFHLYTTISNSLCIDSNPNRRTAAHLYAINRINTQKLLEDLPFIFGAIHLYLKPPTRKNSLRDTYLSILKCLISYVCNNSSSLS
jgi:hypothetical protein